ncbi:MAG: PcfK-like protein [Clostridiales bacterium]|nr:PcfK-like protein [Clostridiales bacterium]
MTKGTDKFKQVIKTYLEKRAKEDELFAPKYANPKKSLDECVDYIIDEVQKSGRQGFADEEIYGMAVHYYDEEDLKVEKGKSSPRVVVNHTVELTEAEKEKIRKEEEEDARRKAKFEYRMKIRKELQSKKAKEKDNKKEKPAPKKAEPKPAEPKQDNQLDLFNMLSNEA